MEDWAEQNETYTFEKVTEKQGSFIRVFWSLHEFLCLGDMFRLDTFEYSKEVSELQSTRSSKRFSCVTLYRRSILKEVTF